LITKILHSLVINKYRRVMPPPKLMGVAEIAELLGISTQRVDQLARQPAFPRPVVELKAGRIWRRADVEAWARRTGRLG
jgi:predicted DNA-binding transcriptional regulator AlpA